MSQLKDSKENTSFLRGEYLL